MYWLTGYDTFGFCFFQSLVVTADGRMALLTRSADLRQAQHTSIIERHPRMDRPRRMPRRPAQLQGPGATTSALRAGRLGDRVRHPRPDPSPTAGRSKRRSPDCELVDASDLVDAASSGEVAGRDRLCQREAAALSDAADRAALALIGAGRLTKGEILAAQHDAIFSRRRRLSRPTSSSSARARTRCSAATRPAGAGSTARDQITLEFAGVYRHYHAALDADRRSSASRRAAPPRASTPRPARRFSPARRRCGRAARPATSSRPMRGCMDGHGLVRAPAGGLRLFPRREVHARPGWTGRCSTRATTGRSSRAW